MRVGVVWFWGWDECGWCGGVWDECWGWGEVEGEEDDGGVDVEGSRERGVDEGEDEGTEIEIESGVGVENGGFNWFESVSELSVWILIVGVDVGVVSCGVGGGWKREEVEG